MREFKLLARQILAAGGDEIVGRIRFQKIAYLLEQKGMHADLWFTYHHYGPFCRDLGEALDWEVALNRVDEERVPVSSGSAYSILRLNDGVEVDRSTVGKLPMEEAGRLVGRLKREPSVVLELAATIHWLKDAEKSTNWREELKRRKTVKATDANIARAEATLRDLGLAC
jgi:uncharacterized protein YwgA